MTSNNTTESWVGEYKKSWLRKIARWTFIGLGGIAIGGSFMVAIWVAHLRGYDFESRQVKPYPGTVIRLDIPQYPARVSSDDIVACTKTNPDLDQLIISCTNVIASNSVNEQSKSEASINRGAAYYRRKDYDRALVDYNEAIRHDRYSARAFNNRGEAFWAKGDDARAFSDFNEAIRLDPNNAQLFLDRGSKHRTKGSQDRAIADFNQAIRLDPRFALAYRYRGGIYRVKGDFDRAIADYDQALRINPSDTGTMADRAITYEAKGNTVATNQDFERVLVARLTINKQYPREAMVRGEAGLTKVAFQIDREGKVIASHIVTSSGHAALDQEALAMVQRAQPFPPPPDQSKDHFDFVIPIRFNGSKDWPNRKRWRKRRTMRQVRKGD